MQGRHGAHSTVSTQCNVIFHIELLCLCCMIMQTWRQTLWSDINTSEMEEGAKQFVKEIKALPKKVPGIFLHLCR